MEYLLCEHGNEIDLVVRLAEQRDCVWVQFLDLVVADNQGRTPTKVPERRIEIRIMKLDIN